MWMSYLEKICASAGIDHRFLFVDATVTRTIGRFGRMVGSLLGICQSAVRVVTTGRSASAIHVNTSLYRSTAFRDALVVAAARTAGMPTLLQIHGGRLANLSEGHPSFRIWRWMFRSATKLGIHSGPQWGEFVEAGYEGKMVRMRNLVPLSKYSANNEGPPHFLFIGRLTEEKGIVDVLDAFQRLQHSQGNEVYLTIAGDGPLLTKIRQRVAECGLKTQVDVTGYVRGCRREEIMRKCNIFLLPSRHQEGFPFAFLECAERGMACLTSTNSAIAEEFDPTRDFLEINVFDPDDLLNKMQQVAEDVELRKSLGRRVQKRVRRSFTVETAGSRFRRIYASLRDQKVRGRISDSEGRD